MDVDGFLMYGMKRGRWGLVYGSPIASRLVSDGHLR